MPSRLWLRLIVALCGILSAFLGTATSAFQFPPPSDDLDTRQIHHPDAWVGDGFKASGSINQSPAEFGPAHGMSQRSFDGYPASGESFPVMTAGSLPGGRSPDGINGSGMRPPVNQVPSIANNLLFGGNEESPFGSNGPNDSNPFSQNGAMPSRSNSAGQNSVANGNRSGTLRGLQPQTTGAPRVKPKMSWAVDTAQQPFVGLVGQVARPGVYEIERRGTLLGDLLQAIGGLAKDASGQFRVIRNGRPELTTSYSGAAEFELMAGDMIIADMQPAQISQRAMNAKQASADAVQIGFVNLIDRPVVLKLKVEHASVYEILSIMRQDQKLASQIKIVVPLSQRGQSQPQLDTVLASETVLIFPPSSVKTERIALLPEPFKLKRESDTKRSSGEAVQPYAPHENISPAGNRAPRSQPGVEDNGTDSAPLPPDAQPISRPSVEVLPDVSEVPSPPVEDIASSRGASGVRGAAGRPENISDGTGRISNAFPAPPAEGLTLSPRDLPPTDVAIDNDNAPIPDFADSQSLDDGNRSAEPSLLNAKGQKRPILLAKEGATNNAILTASELDEVASAADKAGSNWSIWPPILTAGFGLLALIGFSLSLRHRTKSTPQISPVVTTQPATPAIHNSESLSRRQLLDEIIDDRLPLTEERVPFASPMQFHGRPQPPKTIRMDQKHSLPRPHSLGTTEVNDQRSEVRQPSQGLSSPETAAASRTSTTVTQKIRIDRTGTKSGAPVISKTSSHQTTAAGPLDRALSAVQNREERGV